MRVFDGGVDQFHGAAGGVLDFLDHVSGKDCWGVWLFSMGFFIFCWGFRLGREDDSVKFRERAERGGGGVLHTMFMVHSRLDVVDGCIRHPTPLKYSEPFLRGARPRFGFDEGFEGVAVGDADAVGVEARVHGPGGFLELGA